MSNTNNTRSRAHAESGRKGGQVKGVKKGLAWIKENDPDRFAEIIQKGVAARIKANKARKTKTDI